MNYHSELLGHIGSVAARRGQTRAGKRADEHGDAVFSGIPEL